MWRFARSKDVLRELYGFVFPDSLFQLHEFFSGLAGEECDAIGMRPSGLLEVLSLSRVEVALLKPKHPLLLHYRYYRDPPEFFSCLHGYCDGEHWGILLDDPEKGFRGMAAYYNNDGDIIRVYSSPFDAVLYQIDQGLEDAAEDPQAETTSPELERILGNVRGRLVHYIAENHVPLDEGRPRGVESDTGMSLIVPGKGRKRAPSVFVTHQLEDKGSPRIEGLICEALEACERGRPLAALSVGRSLHYWGGNEYSDDAYRLLRSAYLALERPALVRILDLHHQHRDLPNVDVLDQERS